MNEDLRFLSGIGGNKQYTTYKSIRVDNGDDKIGTNATGEFVNKEGRKGNFTRIQFGKEIEAVVVMTKAKIAKSRVQGGVRVQEWFSSEFNPLNSLELIDIRKGGNPKEIVGTFTYKEIQQRYPKVQGESGMKNQYNYETILYINDQKSQEVLRFILTGKSMRNWIEFKGQIQDLWATSIIMKVKEEDRDGVTSYFADFSIGNEVDPKTTEILASALFMTMPKVNMIEADTTSQPELNVGEKKREINLSGDDIPDVSQSRVTIENPLAEQVESEGEESAEEMLKKVKF